MNSRIETFAQILRHSSEHQIRLNRFWGTFIETARFKLGESIKDIKIPFSLDSESTQAIQEAVTLLGALLKKRHEMQFKAPDDRSIDDFVASVKLPARSYATRLLRKETIEADIIQRVLLGDPLMDASLLESWLGPKAAGSRLINALQGILNKAFSEEIKSDHLEKSAYISFLGLIKHLNHAKSAIKQQSIKGIQYEQLDISFGNVLYCLTSSVLSHMIQHLRLRRLNPALEHSFLLLTSTCHPLSFAAIKPSILKFRFNPYGLSQETVDLLDPLYRQISQRDTDLQYVRPSMNEAISASSKIKGPILSEGVLIGLRIGILDFLSENDHPSQPIVVALRELVSDHTSLFNLLCDPKAVNQFADQLKAAGKDGRNERRGEQLADIEDLVRSVSKGGLFRRALAPEEMIDQTVVRYLSYKIDLYIDQYTAEALNLMDNRQIRLDVPHLKQDYESGRLYRISTDAQPLLHGFLEKTEGQLFIDLKDFTKRTHFSKEIAMAEFLGNEFYKPILDAAKNYHLEAAGPTKSIELVNLLGDAVIFSGSIESLVYLAHNIQNLFKDYRNKLKASSPSNLGQELKERVEKRYRRTLDQINQAIQTVRQKTDAARQEIQARTQRDFSKYNQNFPNLLLQEVTRLETEFLALDAKLNAETDSQRRAEVSADRNVVTQQLTTLRALQKQYATGFQKMTPEQQMDLLARFFCRDLYTELSILDESGDTLQKRDATLRYEYERDLKKIEGFGMDAGLFISYGSASERVKIRDDAWGDQEVAIAETINESARGTARNPTIKKMLDARLSEQAKLRGKPDLAYPYNVFVEKTYSFQLSPRKNAEFHSALKNANIAQAEQILHGLLYDSLKDTREVVRGQHASEEQRSLLMIRDIYNEGEAISEEALNAFMRETATSRYNIKRTFPVRKFNQQILEQFLFLIDSFQFVLSLSHSSPKVEPLIFRYAGELAFRGFENKGAIGIYELIKSDSVFYQLLIRHHFTDWLREFDPSLA